MNTQTPTPTPTHPPIVPIAELNRWAQALRAVSQRPLALCPDFPAIARRFEAWWACDATDRPILIGSANNNPARSMTRRLELLDRPDAWLEAKLLDLQQVHRVGDALPTIRADFGPVLLGSLLGGKTDIGSDTMWTHAFIDDNWSNEPDWKLKTDHPWWIALRTLLSRTADQALGRFLVMTPDLGGSADVLLNLRGSSELCLDVIERPERIVAALDQIYHAWHRTFVELYRNTVERGAGVVHWLNIWSDRPYMVPACDFNYMIGPDEFERLLLPDIVRQAATAGRAVFHLDGPGAARHIDALLECPEIQAIQFTPGSGTPSALAWLPMFRKIQERRRALFVFTPTDEVVALAEALRPEGLAMSFSGSLSPRQLDDLYVQVTRRFGGARL